MKKEPKISVIVPVYNTEKYLERCLDSILNQTYRSVELIVVNDCSKGNAKEIVEKYKNNHIKIKYVEHKENRGLFQARLTGAGHATGEYIAFVDSDDYVSIDFYRILVSKAVETNSDIVVGKTVIEDDKQNQYMQTLATLHFSELNGKNCLEQYFHQKGRNYQWHTIWNKIYKKTIWDKAMPTFSAMKNHLIMAEDFTFSTVLFYYANKIVNTDNSYYFYCQHAEASTSKRALSFEKAKKNIEDILLSFAFVEDFMKLKKVYKKYEADYMAWKNVFVCIWLRIVKNSNYSVPEKDTLLGLINQLCDIDKVKELDTDAFYRQTSRFVNQYENIKKMIADPSIKCISFDIFDTLVWRPFLEPKDIFILMNDYFREVCGHKTLLKFSDIRPQCEEEARRIHKDQQDVTYDQIYEHMAEKYSISEIAIELLKQREIESEIGYCLQRESAYELYTLAKYLGKKVVFTSDMYLPKSTIEAILNKNGYTAPTALYVSNEIGLAKWDGDLFDFVVKDQKIKAYEMVHIGDSYHSDKEMPNKRGVIAFLFPKASDTFFNGNPFVGTNNLGIAFKRNLPEWRDSRSSLEFLGIRCMLSVVSNKYFDNPFSSFNEYSDFNGDPTLIGYYALGMHMYALVNWLLSECIDNKYEKMIFMARDGYLPRKIWDVLKKNYNNVPEDYYFPTSRRSLMSLSMGDGLDLHKLHNFVNMKSNSPLQVIDYLSEILNVDNIDLMELFAKNEIDASKTFKDKESFEKFISVVINKLYDKNKASRYIADFRKKYSDLFDGKVAVFDVGYSAKPEAILSNIFEKPIDTFFVHVNSDEGYSNANSFNFKMRTFFDFKPSYTGGIRETLISELAPSCIMYKCVKGDIIPQFEDYTCDYYEEQLVGNMQAGAIAFCEDMTRIFCKDISKLVYEKYGASIPHEMFLHSASEADKSIFKALSFEDTVGMGESVDVLKMINQELKYYNQYPVGELLNFKHETLSPDMRVVELQQRSRPVKLVYYTLFERETLKRRVREIIRNKHIVNALKWNYGLLRKGKNKIHQLTSKK